MPAKTDDPAIKETVLPLSGMQLQWRAADRCFRVRHPGQDEAGTEASHDELLWRQWSGRGDMAVGVSGAPTARSGSNWWVVWGEHTGEQVTVTLADGRSPAMLVLGGLWVCEWDAPEQTVVVSTPHSKTRVRFAPPSFVPPSRAARTGAPRRPAHVETPIPLGDRESEQTTTATQYSSRTTMVGANRPHTSSVGATRRP